MEILPSQTVTTVHMDSSPVKEKVNMSQLPIDHPCSSNQDAMTGETNITTFMHSDLYIAAAVGDIGAFQDKKDGVGGLDLVLTPTKNTILHIYITAQCDTIKSSTTDFVKQILGKCPQLLLQTNVKGETPLHIAARYGNHHTANVLIECAKAFYRDDLERGNEAAREMLRMTNEEKNTALHEAVRYNHLNVVRLLIKEDHEFSYNANDDGETPLYLAAERGFDKIVIEILGSCKKPDYGGPKGRTALHAAVIHNYQGITKSILDRKGNMTKEVDEIGWTPLHHAAHWGYLPMVKLLLKYYKSVAYVADMACKKTPLLIAAGGCHTKIVKELISCCPDCCELVDKKRQNVLHYAVGTKSLDVVRFILKSSPLTYLINAKDDEGNTPVHLLGTNICNLGTLGRNPKFDRMALNKEKLSALDIILANKDFSFWKHKVIRHFKESGVKRGRHNVDYKAFHQRKMNEETVAAQANRWKLEKGNLLVMATLIATVTFAAGFTLPGGYIQDGPNIGTAILIKKPLSKHSS